MMNFDKEEQILRKRLLDLANTAYSRGICIFSDFLNLNEQNIFISLKQELPRIKYFTYGGFHDSERKILCFCGNEMLTEDDIKYPIDCIKVEPLNQKFSDSLNHRDFLGAVLNLGLDRSKIGDILINDNEGYLFAHNGISEFITDQLIKVKHTLVRASLIEAKDFDYKPKFTEVIGTVSSVRLDSILSVAFHSSRSSLAGLIEGGKVYVGGKLILSNSYVLKENDIVSVRGLGKFIFAGTSYQTKKGRYSVKILLYST
ncbi:MAG TPA: YlmH/Sll1252 family protein [Mobilitalea sp.]|nr:YlmH/Sll1252 family protein [Mobilitalea sp.]